MASIRVSCAHCTAVVLVAPAQVLLVPPGGADRFGDYLFFCPRCGRVTVAAAGPGQVLLLLAAGVPADLRDTPDTPDTADMIDERAPVRGPAPAATAPPLTVDDLRALHRLLAGDDWFTRLTAPVARRPVLPHLPEEQP